MDTSKLKLLFKLSRLSKDSSKDPEVARFVNAILGFACITEIGGPRLRASFRIGCSKSGPLVDACDLTNAMNSTISREITDARCSTLLQTAGIIDVLLMKLGNH